MVTGCRKGKQSVVARRSEKIAGQVDPKKEQSYRQAKVTMTELSSLSTSDVAGVNDRVVAK